MQLAFHRNAKRSTVAHHLVERWACPVSPRPTPSNLPASYAINPIPRPTPSKKHNIPSFQIPLLRRGMPTSLHATGLPPKCKTFYRSPSPCRDVGMPRLPASYAIKSPRILRHQISLCPTPSIPSLVLRHQKTQHPLVSNSVAETGHAHVSTCNWASTEMQNCDLRKIHPFFAYIPLIP